MMRSSKLLSTRTRSTRNDTPSWGMKDSPSKPRSASQRSRKSSEADLARSRLRVAVALPEDAESVERFDEFARARRYIDLQMIPPEVRLQRGEPLLQRGPCLRETNPRRSAGGRRRGRDRGTLSDLRVGRL